MTETKDWLGRRWYRANTEKTQAVHSFRGRDVKLNLSVLDRVFGAGDSIVPLDEAPKTRGRKVSHEIVFPEGEFTITGVAKTHGVENITVANALNKLKAHGKTVKIVGKAPKPPGQRGKAAFILKFA